MVKIPNSFSQIAAKVARQGANVYDIIGADGLAAQTRTVANNAANPNLDAFGTVRRSIPGLSPTPQIESITTDGLGSSTGAGGGGGGTTSKDAQDAALRAALKARIGGRGADVDAIYNALFGDLDTLIRTRDAELEDQYGGQLKKASDTYAEALPQIESSYAAIGADSSTDNADAKTKANKGFKETTETIGKNKQKDKAALGQYANENRAKFGADRDSAKRAIDSAGTTTDVDALRGLDNDLAGNLSQAGVTRATLGTDGAARQSITGLTGDNGRYDAAINALDGIIKSSMSGAVKSAAVQAITDAGGLSDEEKNKVKQTYGDVYSEQAAL